MDCSQTVSPSLAPPHKAPYLCMHHAHMCKRAFISNGDQWWSMMYSFFFNQSSAVNMDKETPLFNDASLIVLYVSYYILTFCPFLMCSASQHHSECCSVILRAEQVLTRPVNANRNIHSWHSHEQWPACPVLQEGASARKAQTPAMQPVPRPGQCGHLLPKCVSWQCCCPGYILLIHTCGLLMKRVHVVV